MAYGLGYAGGYADPSGLTRILEIEFDAGVWTDVTADAVTIQTKRGRNRESGAFETGQMTFVLRNDTRKYDPDHTTGPYYGKLRPNRRARFRATYGILTYPVFQGYIDRISQNYGGPNDATATFAASDMFKLLNRVELPVSIYAAEVAADTPAYWWRLDEPQASTVVMDAVTGRTLSPFGTPTLGNAGLVTRDPGSALTMADTTSGFAGTGAFIAAGTTDVTLEAIVKTTATVDSSAVSVSETGAGQRFELFVSAAGKASFKWGKTVGSNTQAGTIDGTSTVNDGNPHHIAGVFNATAGTIALYVDGALQAGPSLVASIVGGGIQELVIGNAATGWVLPAAHTQGLVGTVDEVALYAGQLSAARILAHATARATPWNGDTTGTRINRIADAAGLPTADRAIDTGSTTLQATSLGGTALAYAQKVEETELGRLFVSNAGKLTFVSRANGMSGTYLTSSATLVDADSGAGIGYRSVEADMDEATIVTRATVSRENGVAVSYSDAAAQAEFKIIDETHDGLLHDNDAYSLYYAEWLVNTQKTPVTRVGTVELELAGDPTNAYPYILPLEIGRRVTLKRKPQNTGSVVTQDMRIEAVSHETGGKYWRTRLQLSPFDASGPAGMWVLGTTGFSELDQTTRLGF